MGAGCIRMGGTEMIEALIAAGSAVIVGAMSLVGIVITNSRANNKMQYNIKTSQALTDQRLDDLTREVRAHNEFASRVPVLEEQMKVVNHRLHDLEAFHKHP